MWYFAWILGLGFAVLLAIVNAVWLEYEQGRLDSYDAQRKKIDPHLEKTPK